MRIKKWPRASCWGICPLPARETYRAHYSCKIVCPLKLYERDGRLDSTESALHGRIPNMHVCTFATNTTCGPAPSVETLSRHTVCESQVKHLGSDTIVTEIPTRHPTPSRQHNSSRCRPARTGCRLQDCPQLLSLHTDEAVSSVATDVLSVQCGLHACS